MDKILLTIRIYPKQNYLLTVYVSYDSISKTHKEKVMKREVGIAPPVPESLGWCEETQKAID
jgi:hypothetical protein